jgi:hypothetical protein
MTKITLTPYRKMALMRLGVFAPFALIMTADSWYCLLIALLVFAGMTYAILSSEEPSEEEQKKQKPYVYEPIHKLTDVNMGTGSLEARKRIYGF